MLPTTLRAGLVGDVDAGDDAHVDVVMGLMRAFAKDALVVAGRYACGSGRRAVTATDMRGALMYCARTFFEQDDSALAARVRDEVVEMNEGDTDETDSEAAGGTETDSEEADEEGEGEAAADAPPPSDARLVRHVDAIVAAWPQWHPDDPVHVLIKRAIDQTALE